MCSQSHRLSSLPLTLPLVSLLLMVWFPLSLSTPELYRNCLNENFTCGDISVGYPFSGGNRLPECGHPHLSLECETERNITIIEILGERYQVLHIDQDHTLTIVGEDLINNGFCSPDLPQYPTLDSNLFEFVNPAGGGRGYPNLTLFYDCLQGIGIGSSILGPFPCSKRPTNSKYKNAFVMIGNIPPPPGCSAINVTIPILQTSFEGISNSSLNWEQALKKGFDVKWKIADEQEQTCRKCRETKGACGFYYYGFWGNKNETICFCSIPFQHWDKNKGCIPPPPGQAAPPPAATTHGQGSNGNKKNIGLVVGLGFAGAVLAAGIALAMICLRRRQQRKKIADQKSRDLLAPPSSKGTSTSTTNTSQSNESIPPYPTPKYDRDLEKGSTYFGAHVFSYEELEQATDNFNPSKELGEGGFGTVYYGVLNDGRVVAVKRLYESNYRRVDQYMNEIKILTGIRHPNLVTLYGCTSKRSRELLLVYEYIPNGTVADHLHGKLVNTGLLTWPVRLNIAVETANALAYLHATDIIHRDVKTNNILLDEKLHVKVADFGLSRLFPNDVTHVSTAPQGTPGYVDPEYYQCYKLTEKSDVYSFGVVLIELISAKEAVDTSRHRHDINLANMAVSRIQKNTLQELVDPSLGFDKDYTVNGMITSVAELAFRCLQQEREVRPSMKEVLDVLKGIQNKEELGVVQRTEVVDINPEAEAEMVDIRSDDVGLLKHNVTPPDSATDKWMQIRSM